jgi:hypothetical protein
MDNSAGLKPGLYKDNSTGLKTGHYMGRGEAKVERAARLGRRPLQRLYTGTNPKRMKRISGGGSGGGGG